MSPGQRKMFEDELERIVRRAQRLRAALEGSADLREIKVAACKVAEHERGAHTRYVVVRRSK